MPKTKSAMYLIILLSVSLYVFGLPTAVAVEESNSLDLPTRPEDIEDKPIKIEFGSEKEARSYYAYSDRWSEASIKFRVKGKNLKLNQDSSKWRSLSIDNNDPVCRIEPMNSKRPIKVVPYLSFHIGENRARPNLEYIYCLPFKKGLRFKISQGSNIGTHKKSSDKFAVDFGMEEGTIVCAARRGKVVGFREDSFCTGSNDKYRGCANYIYIKHADGSYAEYAHLKPFSRMVKLGDEVKDNQPIALSGNTGFSSGPHLHFCVFLFDSNHIRRSLPCIFSTKAGLSYHQRTGEILDNPAENSIERKHLSKLLKRYSVGHRVHT